ncbi:unnamed protein product, partial [Auanema sp. JU1783]
QHVTADGSIVPTDDEGKPLGPDGDVLPTDASDNYIYPSVGPDDELEQAETTSAPPVTVVGPDGTPLVTDASGQHVTADGSIVPTDDEGKPLGPEGDVLPTDASGNYIYPSVRPESVVENDKSTKSLVECRVKGLKSDIVIVVESGGSEKFQNDSLKSIEQFLEVLDLSPDVTRLGVILAAGEVLVPLPLGGYQEKEHLKSILIEANVFRDGSDLPLHIISTATIQQFKTFVRADAQKIVIFLTPTNHRLVDTNGLR